MAVDNFLAGLIPVPDITAHPLQTTIKYGFGVNFEQPWNDWIGVFGRRGWNEGRHESYVYTEVDESRAIINNISRLAVLALSSVTAASLTVAKISSKRITRCTLGAGFTRAWGFST